MESEKDAKVGSWLVAGAGAAALAAVPNLANAGGYVGVGVGEATVEVDTSDIDPAFSDFDESDTAWKIFGGWMFTEHLGVEVAYMDFGDMDSNLGIPFLDGSEGIDVQADGFALYGVGKIPVGPVDLFGKLGMISYDVKASIKNIPGFENVNADDDGEEFAWGVGATWNIGAFGIRAEYEGFDIADEASLFTLSAQYSF